MLCPHLPWLPLLTGNMNIFGEILWFKVNFTKLSTIWFHLVVPVNSVHLSVLFTLSMLVIFSKVITLAMPIHSLRQVVHLQYVITWTFYANSTIDISSTFPDTRIRLHIGRRSLVFLLRTLTWWSRQHWLSRNVFKRNITQLLLQ